jgi:hypothetical protein
MLLDRILWKEHIIMHETTGCKGLQLPSYLQRTKTMLYDGGYLNEVAVVEA